MKEIRNSSPPTFPTETAKAHGAHGVHPRDLYALRHAGQIVELSAVCSGDAEAPPASYPDALAVVFRSPRAIVCCLSAAAVHELTDELPRVWAND